MEEKDDLGVPIKKSTTSQATDDLGVPLKKKESTEPSTTTSESSTPAAQQDSEPSATSGEVIEPVALPKSYQYNRSNTSELEVGKTYQTTSRETKRWNGEYFEKNPDASPLKPLLEYSLKGMKGIVPEMMEKLDTLPSGIGDKKTNIAEAYRKTEDVQNEAAQLAEQNLLLTSFMPVQELNQLNEQYAQATPEQKVDLQKQIDDLANKPITNKDFEGARFSRGDLNVSQNFTPTVKAGQALEEYEGEEPSNVVPEKIKTVGDAYAKAKQNEEFIKDAQAESFTLNSITKAEQQKLLDPEQVAFIEAIQDPVEKEAAFTKAVEESKTDTGVTTSFLRGMNHTIENLFNTGQYMNMKPDELMAEMKREYYKDQLFGVQPEGIAAKTSEGIGGIVPDMAIAATGLGMPGMLASISARHPQDALKQYYFDKFSKGEEPDYNEGWKFATASTAINTAVFAGAGLTGKAFAPKISNTITEAGVNFLKGTVKNAAKDAAIFGLGGKAIQDLNSNAFDVEHDNDYVQSAIDMGVFGGVMHTITHAPAILRAKMGPNKINKAIDIASFLPAEYTTEMVRDGQEKGFITPEQGEEILLRQDRIRNIVNQFPKELTLEQIQEIEPLFAEKEKLMRDMKGEAVSETMKKMMREKVKELDEKALIKGAVPLTGEEKSEYRDLISADATEGGKVDKGRLTYLRKRMEAASKEKEEGKQFTREKQPGEVGETETFDKDGKKIEAVEPKAEEVTEPVSEPKQVAEDLTDVEALKFIDDHAVQPKIQKSDYRPNFGLSSAELEMGLRHIADGKMETVSAKRILDKIAVWKKQGYVDVLAGGGGTKAAMSKKGIPFDLSKEVADLEQAQVDEVLPKFEEIESKEADLDKWAKDNGFEKTDGTLDLEKLSVALKSAEENPWNSFLELSPEQLNNLKQAVENEKSGTTLKGTTDEGGDKNSKGQADLAKDYKVTAEIESAKQKLQSAKDKAKAIRDAKQNLKAVEDPFEETKKQAEADREVFDAYVDLAKEYIKQGIKNVEDFAKELEEDVSDLIKGAWDVASGGKKKTILTERAYEGAVREEVKKHLESKGLTREVVSQEQRSAEAEEFINQFGEETAIEAVKNFDVRGAKASAILAKVILRTQDAIGKLDATETEALDALARREADLIDFMGKEGFLGGEFNSQLAYEYEHSDIGYSSVKKAADWKKEFGQEPSAEMLEKWKQRDKEFDDLNKKLAEAEARASFAEEKQAIADIKESVEREKKSRRYTTRAKEVADNIRKLKTKPIQLVDENGNVIDLTTMGVTWNDLVEGVAKAVEAGGKLADAIDNSLKGAEWYSKLTDKGKEAVKKQIEDALSVPTEVADKVNVSHSKIRGLVESDIEDIESLVRELKKDYPNKTDREIRDAVTGYGKIVNPNKEEVEVKIRKMKRIGKAISALEDVRNKKRPLRSGQQRDKLDAEERALNKELREAMKDLPQDEADIESQLKTQLDAAKQRTLNQIEDLQREIDKGELTPKSARTVKEDAELKTLKEQRDALKKEHDEIFKDEEYKQEKRLELTKKATERRIEDLQRRINEGDFSKKKSAPLIADNELTQLKAQKLRLQNEYEKEFYKEKLRNRTDWDKAKDHVWDAWGLTRGLSATAEASFVGIQGLVQSISHPGTALKALKNSWQFFKSPAKTEAWLENIKAQEWYPTLKQSKLALTEPHAEVTAREELFNSGWTDMIWNGVGKLVTLGNNVAFEKWKAINPIKAVERASVGYLDTLRVERFLDGMQILQEQGKTFDNSPKDYKDVADAINTLTGRGSLGAMEQNAEILSKLFFSPRNWSAQFKTATPYALYHFGKMTPTARKMAVSDFSKFVGLTTSMVAMAAVGLANDDDPETSVELDPRSSDFGKIKLGNKRVDPWGGRIQQVVLTSRLMMDMLHDASPELSKGGMKTSKGEIVPLGTPFKAASKGGVALKMAINKLAPSAALLERYLVAHEKKDGTKVDEYGKPYTFTDELKESLVPIYWGTVADLLKDDPNALSGLLVFYAFFGGGVNVYDSKKKKKNKEKKKKKKEWWNK